MNKWLVIILISSFISCDYSDDRLQVYNTSENDISMEFYKDSIPTLAETGNVEYYLRTVIKAGDKKRIMDFGGTNGWPFRVANSSNNRLNVVVYDANSILGAENMNDLLENKKYKYYAYSIEELEALNWTISVE